jgi:hypothetical protein
MYKRRKIYPKYRQRYDKDMSMRNFFMDFLSIVNNIEDRETLVGKRGEEIVRNNANAAENDTANEKNN